MDDNWILSDKQLLGFTDMSDVPKSCGTKDQGHFLFQSAHRKGISLVCGMNAHILTLHYYINSKFVSFPEILLLWVQWKYRVFKGSN